MYMYIYIYIYTHMYIVVVTKLPPNVYVYEEFIRLVRD